MFACGYRVPMTGRRTFLLATGALVLLRPSASDATTASMQEAIRKIVGDAQVRKGQVKLDLPPLIDNGNAVALSVSVDSPMTPADHVKAIHVFNEKNPQPNVVSAFLGSARRPRQHRDAHPHRRHRRR